MAIFCWNAWNIAHIDEHDVLPREAEEVVRGARAPFPRDNGDEKFLVWGQTSDGRYLQVVYILPVDDEVDVDALSQSELLAFLDGEDVIYVIHAMDMTERQKHQYRKQRGRR